MKLETCSTYTLNCNQNRYIHSPCSNFLPQQDSQVLLAFLMHDEAQLTQEACPAFQMKPYPSGYAHAMKTTCAKWLWCKVFKTIQYCRNIHKMGLTIRERGRSNIFPGFSERHFGNIDSFSKIKNRCFSTISNKIGKTRKLKSNKRLLLLPCIK